MGMNSTPSSERVHIGIFGRRNAGKSSLINAMTGQQLSIVSPVEGTTTDPVQKTMELLPLGPVVLIDTPGIDDEGELGSLRVARSYQMLNKSDIALLVVNGVTGLNEEDLKLLERIKEKKIPCMVVLNQVDLLSEEELSECVEKAQQRITLYLAGNLQKNLQEKEVHENSQKQVLHEKLDTSEYIDWKTEILAVSALTGFQIHELKETLANLIPEKKNEKRIVADLIQKDKFTVLVVPIDKAAPKGRLILPQQQTIRDILETGGLCVVVRDVELTDTLKKLEGQVGLVITDSQVFGKISKIVPEDIPMTSFSILFARYKGELEPFLSGIKALKTLEDGDKVLISEGCTHHRQCNDIGTVKIPKWIRDFSGESVEFVFTSGGEFPVDVSEYKMIVHCGGCMLNEREMHYRIACAQDAGIPITNYGMLIAYVTGILERSLQPVISVIE